MNNFNKVFLVVKKHCEKQKKLAEVNCFITIAKEAEIPVGNLEVYLKHLQDIGLIKFSMTDKYDKYIYLTSFGKKQEKLIEE